MNNDQLINIFTILLIIMICILLVLCIIFVTLKIKSKKPKESKKEIKKQNNKGEKNTIKSYSRESIFKFMDFDKIEDNMIVQKNGKRFLMIIECQGINYDLMSGLEKNSVEQGFLQFLNTLRYPIQIYVQTRTVNLTSSIDTYKERVKEIAKNLANKQVEYNQKVRSGQYNQNELDKEKYEIIRQKNLYEYGVDIISNTERMSLNKSILSKHYYIIISYYADEIGNNDFDKEEISNMAFSELYTKAQTIINALAVCGINSKILDSIGLTELLYVAYNRDESEIFNLRRALNAGYEDLYSTAPDVLDKRMKELDIKVEEEALKKANEIVFSAIEESEKERRVKQKEKTLYKLIDQMAISIIEENERNLGEDIAKRAVNKIEKETKEKGGNKDEKKATTRRRKSTKSI